MPTTFDEAHMIADICHEYLPATKLAELFTRLNDEVGTKTDNDSLRDSLRMLAALATGASYHCDDYSNERDAYRIVSPKWSDVPPSSDMKFQPVSYSSLQAMVAPRTELALQLEEAENNHLALYPEGDDEHRVVSGGIAELVALYVLVSLHITLIFANTAAFFVLPFVASLAVAAPLMTSIMSIMFAPPRACPLTRLENRLRRRLGMQEIRGFLSHYVLKPATELRERFAH